MLSYFSIIYTFNKSILFKFFILLFFFNFFLIGNIFSQNQFTIIDGKYSGKMLIYKGMNPVDSVPVVLTIQTIIPDSVWQWKTEYLSAKMPVTKDYKLCVADRSKGIYLIDEGDSVILYNYLLGNKLYCQFETGSFLLTSTYEFTNDNELIFEVTAGRKIPGNSTDEIINYQINTLQKTTFKRNK